MLRPSIPFLLNRGLKAGLSRVGSDGRWVRGKNILTMYFPFVSERGQIFVSFCAVQLHEEAIDDELGNSGLSPAGP